MAGSHDVTVTAAEGRVRRRLSTATLTWLVLSSLQGVPMVRAEDTSISFDDLPNFTDIANQYSGLGVTFCTTGTCSPLETFKVRTGVAHSGTQVAVNSLTSVEFCSFDVRGSFTSTRQHVGVFVGDLNNVAYPVALTAYDVGGTQIATDQQNQSGSGHVDTQLAVSSSTANIASIEIFIPNGGPPCPHTAIDDLSFDNPATPPPPDFGFIPTNVLSVGLPQGESAQVGLVMHRINGSIGNVQFSARSLPAGVSASFSPNPTNGGEGSTVTLTLIADANALPIQNGTVLVTAAPLDTSAGTQSHTHVLGITVQSTYEPMVTGIDITQGVQTTTLPTRDPANPGAPVAYKGVSLQAHGKTIVRVFVDTPGAPSVGVPGATILLYGLDASNNLIGPPLLPESGPSTLINSGCVVPQVGNCYDEVYKKANASYDFTLPDSWTSGTISLQAVINPPTISFAQTPQIIFCATAKCLAEQSFTLTGITFTPTATYDIRPVLFTFNSGCSEFPAPAAPGVWAAFENVTPLGLNVPDYVGTIEACDIEHMTDDDGDLREDQDEEAIARLQDWASNNSGFGFAVGVATFAVGDTDHGDGFFRHAPVAVVDYRRPLTIVGHETSHLLGRHHASGACGGIDGGDADGWPPDEIGLIQGLGVDRRGAAPYQVIQDAMGQSGVSGVYDFMSYCAPGNLSYPQVEPGTWISVRGWNQLIEGNVRTSSGPVAPSVSGAPGIPVLEVFASASRVADILSVRPSVGQTPPPPANTPYRLLALDKTGAVIADSPLIAGKGHIDQASEQTSFLSGTVPAAGVTELEIVRNGIVLAKRVRSSNPPTVSIINPAPATTVGDGANVTVQWAAKSADHLRLKAIVQYSTNDGASWRALFVGPSTGQVTLPSRLFAGSQLARVRVLINDGFNQTAAESGRFTALGSAPVVRISDPAPGQQVANDTMLYLHGQAFDDASNPIKDGQLQWLDGTAPVGGGPAISARVLAPGSHTIQLVAHDNQGRTGSASVQINVIASAPRFINLDVPKQVSRTATSLTLGIASSIPATLAVDAQGVAGGAFAVGPTARPITLQVHPGIMDLVLPLRLTANGKMTIAVAQISRR